MLLVLLGCSRQTASCYNWSLSTSAGCSRKNEDVVPFGTDPIALMEVGFSVLGFVYFFKSKKNRDALYKFLNDIHTDTSLVNRD